MKKWLIYSGLALTIMAPMLLPGYIFALDMAFAPQIRLPEQVTSSYPFYALLHFLNIVIPSQILQKAMLFAILVLSGAGMYSLVRWLQRGQPQTEGSAVAWGAYIAGALYMINPFTYSRFMVGQFAVLLGYALLPFFVMALLRLYDKPDMRRALILAGWLTGIGIVSIHTIGLAAVIVLVSSPLLVHRHRANPRVLAQIGKFGAVSLGAVLLLSAYWTLPLITGASNTAEAIAGFDRQDQQAFATVGGDVVNRVANVLQLQGFWAEGVHSYLLPQDLLPIWFLVIIGLWILVGKGFGAMVRQGRRFEAALFGSSAVIAVILAATSLSHTLADYIPIFGGYREPQKFVGIVALAFAVFAAFGIDRLLQRKPGCSDTRLAAFTIAVLILPFALTPTMFWAFGGQLMPKQYPKDWSAMNDTLNKDAGPGRVVFLPWHLYMSFSFTDRVVVNPAEQFFDRPTIVSNELEYEGASPTMPDNQKSAIGRLLKDARQGKADLASGLARHDVKYILLSKDDDHRSYAFVAKQPGIKPVQETETLALYRNEQYRRQP
jgi:hypothetical protein